MQGAFDEASLRLAEALRRPPEHVEAALQDVGVDAPYLSRALVEGDPQGAIDAVSRHLGVPPKDLVLAILRASGEERRGDPSRAPAPGSAPQVEALHELLSFRLPRLLSRVAAVALVGGLALASFAALALVRPDLFRALLFYAAAGFVGLGSFVLLVAAWRMRRAARALRRMARLDLTTKR